MTHYAGLRAAVIGGTHGMGWATARALLDGGARVLVTGRNAHNVDQAQATLGESATVIRSDIAHLPDIDALGRQVEQGLGPLDAVFIFAGIAELAPFDQVSEASFDRHFDINTKGVYFTVQRLAPHVREGGSITLTTVTPATATPGMSVYMGTKAAVGAFARSFAAELLPRRIRVNAIAPGFIDTPSLGLAGLTPEQRLEMSALGDAITPMQRHGTMDEIARAALFLSFDATFSTGIELAVDGGLSTVDPPQPA